MSMPDFMGRRWMVPGSAYSRTAVVLHWLAALLILAAFPLGLYMSDLPLSPLKLRLFSYHKWLGVTVFLLATLHLTWRLGHVPAPLPASVPAWQRRAAGGVHVLLYALMLAIPLCGWFMSSAKGMQTVYLGVLPLPDLIGRDKALGHALAELHEALAYGMMGLVLGHVGAALKHHFIDHDGVLARMLPFLGGESER